eukprot:m.37555 g.37555  ORF g.37555 m.37555 type:complete len:498 (-) comp9327_c0_seq1:100-1593(-)
MSYRQITFVPAQHKDLEKDEETAVEKEPLITDIYKDLPTPSYNNSKRKRHHEPVHKRVPKPKRLSRLTKKEMKPYVSRLFRAAEDDDLNTLVQLRKELSEYENGKDVLDETDSFGWTALFMAAAGGATNAVTYMLHWGGIWLLRHKEDTGMTAIDVARNSNNFATLSQLSIASQELQQKSDGTALAAHSDGEESTDTNLGYATDATISPPVSPTSPKHKNECLEVTTKTKREEPEVIVIEDSSDEENGVEENILEEKKVEENKVEENKVEDNIVEDNVVECKSIEKPLNERWEPVIREKFAQKPEEGQLRDSEKLRAEMENKPMEIAIGVGQGKEETLWCEKCQFSHRVGTLDHIHSIAHIVEMQHKVESRPYVLKANNKGFQMMLRQGWDDTKGLGKHEDGTLEPCKTVLKRDRYGIAHKKAGEARVTHFKAGDFMAVADKRYRPIYTANGEKIDRKQYINYGDEGYDAKSRDRHLRDLLDGIAYVRLLFLVNINS